MCEETKNAGSTLVVNFFRMLLGFHFENVEHLAEYAKVVQANESLVEGHFMQVYMRYYVGMSFFYCYKQTGHRKYYVRARRITSIFRKWSKRGLSNVDPLFKALNMQRVSIKSVSRNPTACYRTCNDAIAAAETDSNALSRAMAYEYAVSIMLDMYDRATAARYIRIALDQYTKLEAFGKVEFLQQRYNFLLEENPRDV